MDSILKNRFDKYRADQTFPPEMLQLENMGIKPFEDLEKLNEWRQHTSALQVTDEKVGYTLQGKIDDVLVESDGRLIPADYKSSGNAPAEDKQKYYTDQLAAYGLMFHKAGHLVSDRAYLLHYFTNKVSKTSALRERHFVKDKSDGAIDVTFDSHLDLVKIDLAAIEQKLADIVKLLNGPYPGNSADCDKCAYYSGRRELLDTYRLDN